MRARRPLLFTLILLLSSASTAWGQNPGAAPRLPAGPGRIEGLVTDSAGAPLGSVAITLRSAKDSALVTGELTGKDGRFRIEGLQVGGYFLHVSLIGYRPRSSEVLSVTAESPRIDLGAIALKAMAVELDGLTATAERSAVVIEADRTIYNTKSMPVASTGNATDVLRAVPELEVDVNDNIKLRGNQAVAIHLNGRPAPLRGEQLANFLRQLPGNRIQRVEVMPNPSAKHDPEGMGGIVNIVLADDLDLGLSGNVSVNASTRNRQYVNGRLNYQKGRLTLFTGMGVSTYRSEGTTYDLRRNLITTPVTLIEQNSASDNRSTGGNLDWTAELKVGRQATLWSNAWIYSNGADTDGTSAYGILDETRVALDQYDRASEGSYHSGNYNLGAGFKQVFQPQKQELTIDARWSWNDNDSDTRDLRTFALRAGEPVDLPPEVTLNTIDGGNGNVYAQADYFRPAGKGRLDLGYRAYRREQDNDNQLRVFESEDATTPRSGTASGYDYAETFHSLYGTWGRTAGKFGMQLGLRAELSSTHFESLVGGASFDRSYNTLFPSVNLSWNPVRGRTLRLLYSKRISRPQAYYLDPYTPAVEPLNVYRGNPDLRPSYTQSVSMDYNWSGKRGTLRVGPYFRYSTDVWERIRTVDTAGVATSRWENAASSKVLGSNFTVSLPPTRKLSGSVSFSVYRDERDGTNISSAYHRAALLWSLGGNIGAKVTPTLTAQTFGTYFPSQSILQGRASGYAFTSVSLRQQLLKTKGSVALSISDPFNLYHFDSSTRDATYIQTSRSSYSSRVLTLGLTYNFGKPPQQQSRRSGPEEAGETIRVR